MTRDEFETAYCERSNITVESFRKWRVVLPCECSDPSCKGWAAVSTRDAGLLLNHLANSLPDHKKLRELELRELAAQLGGDAH